MHFAFGPHSTAVALERGERVGGVGWGGGMGGNFGLLEVSHGPGRRQM